MADKEELAPEAELEPGLTPEVKVEEKPEAEAEPGGEAEAEAGAQAQADRLEALALRRGWKPRNLYKGNQDDWRDAEAFIDETFNINSQFRDKLKRVESTVENMSRTSAMLLEQQLERQRQELEGRFQEAVEAGDPQAARQVRDQIGQLSTQFQPSQAPTTEGQQFIERNSSWYGKDQEATAYAVNRTDYYAQQGLSPARQLAAVEQDMKGIFPDLFPAPRTPAKPAPAVQQPPSRTAATSSRKKSFHDLPPEAQAVARDMHDRLGIPLEQYVSNYFAAQPERKVG